MVRACGNMVIQHGHTRMEARVFGRPGAFPCRTPLTHVTW